VNLAALIALGVKLDARDFATRFPEPMLVVRKRSTDPAPAGSPSASDLDWRAGTRAGGSPIGGGFNTAMQAPGERKSLSAVGWLATATVEPIKKSLRNPFEGMITIGRAPNNDICLYVSSVSKLHAYFRREGGKWVLRDKQSSNGTFVNGQRLKPEDPIAVEDGAQILFGPDAEALFKQPLSLHTFLVQVQKLGK
jgi:hypothetical protein